MTRRTVAWDASIFVYVILYIFPTESIFPGESWMCFKFQKDKMSKSADVLPPEYFACSLKGREAVQILCQHKRYRRCFSSICAHILLSRCYKAVSVVKCTATKQNHVYELYSSTSSSIMNSSVYWYRVCVLCTLNYWRIEGQKEIRRMCFAISAKRSRKTWIVLM